MVVNKLSEVRVTVAVRCKVFTAVLLKIVLDCHEDGGSRLFRNVSIYVCTNPRSFKCQNTGRQYWYHCVVL